MNRYIDPAKNKYRGLENLLLEALQNISYIEKTTCSYKALLIRELIREALILTTKDGNEETVKTLRSSTINH